MTAVAFTKMTTYKPKCICTFNKLAYKPVDILRIQICISRSETSLFLTLRNLAIRGQALLGGFKDEPISKSHSQG